MAAFLAGIIAGAAFAQEPSGPPPGDEQGPPPGGDQDGPPRPPPGSRGPFRLSGAYTLDDGTSRAEAGRSYASAASDVSAVFVSGKSSLKLARATVSKTGDTSSEENSSFHGLNAAVLAAKGGTIAIEDGVINAHAEGANGAFATGSGSSVTLARVRIDASGGGAHGVMVSGGGAMTLTDVEMRTTGAHGAAMATDRGGGTILVNGGSAVTGGQGSPAFYSTGTIAVTGGTYAATGSEAAVIEGSNSIRLHGTEVSGAKLCGVMIYQSFSGDAEGRCGTFTMEGGMLTALVGPAFYVTNTTGVINLTGAKVSAHSGTLVKVAAGRWGRRGANGGSAALTARREILNGDLLCDEISSITAAFQEGTQFTGRISRAALTIDGTSHWYVAADSILTSLTDPDGLKDSAFTNIHGNGHTVRYDAKLISNRWLGGKSYKLADGGDLIPIQ